MDETQSDDHSNPVQKYDGGGNDSKCNANDNNGEYDYNQLLLKIKELTLEKDNMETDFGRKRAKFKDLFLQKEDELKNQRDKYENELLELTRECVQLKNELDESRSLVTVAQYEKENALEVEQRKCRDEVASLRRILSEKIEEIKRNYELELNKLKKENERLEAEILEKKSSESENLLSVVTKSLKQKVGSLNTSISSSSIDDIKQKEVQQHDEEFDLVLPFEEEVKSLKEKLRMTDTKLQSYEQALSQVIMHFGSDSVIDVIKSNFDHSNINIISELSNASNDYNDLETYLAMLTTERTALLIQIEKLKKEGEDLKRGTTKLKSVSPSLYRKFMSPGTQTSLIMGSTPNIPSQLIHKKLQRSQSLTFSDSDLKGSDKRELKQLSDELKKVRERLKMPCEMCRNYEIQLQSVQNNQGELRMQLAHSQELLKNFKDDLKKEQKFRSELEEKFNEEAKQAEKQIRDLCGRLDASQNNIISLKKHYTQFCKEANDTNSSLLSKLEELSREVDRLTRENDSLLGKYIARSQVLQSEPIDLPGDIDEMQFYCLKLREDLIATLVAKERNEEALKSEILFLKDQIIGEQQTKETIEETLTQDNDLLRSTVDSLQSELNDIKSKFLEQKQNFDECSEKLSKMTLENEQKFSDLQAQINDLTAHKAKLESEASSLRNKVQSLQIELDNSEEVQRDFVKLSQSLQIQLEKIRQADTEVRWQHEDDATECNLCKKTFHSRKEKSNCSHCGRIYCSDCNNKVIHSGPKRRPCKVCSVCHTLLDNQTACWFANEAPHSPS